MKAPLLVLFFFCCAAPVFAQADKVEAVSDSARSTAITVQQNVQPGTAALCPEIRTATSSDTSETSAFTVVDEQQYSAGASTILATKKICWLPFKRATFS